MMISVMCVGINLIVDLLYFAIDPRLKVDRAAAAR
jgi:peptide/nickel transport system permease protein